jgi:hypothetical protein
MYNPDDSGGGEMRRIMVLVSLFLVVFGAVALELWRQSRVPRLSYRLVAVPYPFAGSPPCQRDELEDGECFIVRNETYGKHALSFYRRLIAPCKIEDALRLKMEIDGDTITITESYAYMPICEVRPYEIEGEIEPPQGWELHSNPGQPDRCPVQSEREPQVLPRGTGMTCCV